MVQTIQPQALAIIVTFPVISTIFIALRVAFRTWNRQFKWGMSLFGQEMAGMLTLYQMMPFAYAHGLWPS
jgi:hypothetical protein